MTAFDRAILRLDPGMVVVTAAAAGERAGCLVGFASQCSINPPRFLVCLSKRNHTYRVATRASTLAVHLLTHDDMATAELFGEATGDRVDKFAQVPWRPLVDGTPLLTGLDHWFAGAIVSHLDAGDHVAFVIEPTIGSDGDGEPLRLADVLELSPGHDP